MRTQYYSRPSPNGVEAWDVHRLIELSSHLATERVPLASIRELDESYWSEQQHPLTCREIADHARLISETDLAFPIILSSDGRVMDGMHRVCKALLLGLEEIEAVRFVHDPEPDHIGVALDDLPYPE